MKQVRVVYYAYMLPTSEAKPHHASPSPSAPRGEPANRRARMKLDHKSFALSSCRRTREEKG